MEKKSNIHSIEKMKDDNFEIIIIETKNTYYLEMKIQDQNLYFKCENKKFPISFCNSFNYDSLMSVKQMKIYDNIKEIFEFLLKKFEKKEFNLLEKENEIIINFLIYFENDIINFPIILTKSDISDINGFITKILNYNQILENRIEKLEIDSKNSELRLKNLELLETKIEKLEIALQNMDLSIKHVEKNSSFWGTEPILCWKCGQKNNGSKQFRKKLYNKNDGRKDDFVLGGFWGVCLTCDPNGTYNN